VSAAIAESRRFVTNNVGVLRLLLALVICVGHAAQLSGQRALDPLASALSSPYRVSAFFVLSGFLIFRSYERSSSLASYTRRRILRIYPMYAFVVLLCAVGLSAVSSAAIGDYFSAQWIGYVAANLSFLGFLQPTLPGVFGDNVRPEINGALWTLKVEVMFYLAVPLFVALFARAGRLRVMVMAYLLSIGYAAAMTTLAAGRPDGPYDELARQLPGQLAFLMAGAFAYYYLPIVERHVRAIAFGAVAALGLNVYLPLTILEPLALAGAVIALALFTPVMRIDPSRNVSYALFLVHFPIAQSFVHVGWLDRRPYAFLAAVTAVSLAAAAVLDVAARRLVPLRTTRGRPLTGSATPATV
jgi:peptidoglycan/LPS O-acetylase OafA/YrhL